MGVPPPGQCMSAIPACQGNQPAIRAGPSAARIRYALKVGISSCVPALPKGPLFRVVKAGIRRPAAFPGRAAAPGALDHELLDVPRCDHGAREGAAKTGGRGEAIQEPGTRRSAPSNRVSSLRVPPAPRCRHGRWPGRGAAARSRPAAQRNARGRTRRGTPRPTASARPEPDASATRRGRCTGRLPRADRPCASVASRSAVMPSAASCGMICRRRGRVWRGSRLLASSAKAIPAACAASRGGAPSEWKGTAARATSPRLVRTRRALRHRRANRPGRCRARAAAIRSRPDRRAYVRSAHDARRLSSPRREQRIARVTGGLLEAGLRLGAGPAAMRCDAKTSREALHRLRLAARFRAQAVIDGDRENGPVRSSLFAPSRGEPKQRGGIRPAGNGDDDGCLIRRPNSVRASASETGALSSRHAAALSRPSASRRAEDLGYLRAISAKEAQAISFWRMAASDWPSRKSESGARAAVRTWSSPRDRLRLRPDSAGADTGFRRAVVGVGRQPVGREALQEIAQSFLRLGRNPYAGYRNIRGRIAPSASAAPASRRRGLVRAAAVRFRPRAGPLRVDRSSGAPASRPPRARPPRPHGRDLRGGRLAGRKRTERSRRARRLRIVVRIEHVASASAGSNRADRRRTAIDVRLRRALRSRRRIGLRRRRLRNGRLLRPRLHGGGGAGAARAARALIAALGRNSVFLRAAQLLFELLIAELQLLDLAGEHAHLVLDLVEPHDDIGGRHLRASRGCNRAGKRDQGNERVRDMGSSHT